ncbi:MAG: thiamine pyrophosphate-dependent enzyme [Planctomycetota bacterium]|nr:dehydrogenase [Planctomycetota bacterium]
MTSPRTPSRSAAREATAAAGDVRLDRAALLDLYRTMLTIRLAEEELARCHQRGLIHGACHTSVGQEAVAAGVCGHLRPDDVIFSTHRGHGHALAKGLPPEQLFAELFGRASGCSRGRGGSMHLFAPEIGLLGTSGIVGPCILQAAGGGYAFRLAGTGGVAVAFFGDGAVNNGAFHEGLNMAAIWKLPVLFVCENNQYATEVPFSEASGIPDVGRRGASYGLVGEEVDGNDVLAVHAAAARAVARARRGDGATLIECKTYRTRAHAEGMGDFDYRTREEVAAWKDRCPIAGFRRVLEAEHGVPATDLDAVEAAVADLVTRSRAGAEAAPEPAAADATTHVSAAPRAVREPTPDPAARQIAFIPATVEALDAAMSADPSIFVLGEGVGRRGGNFRTTAGLYATYGPERLRDTPICERGFTGLACGAAMAGARPVVDFMFIDFLLDAWGELVNQIAKMRFMSSGRLRMPVVLRGCIGMGHSAATHHSGSYYGMLAQVPGLRVVVPSTPRDAKGLFAHALRGEDPVLFLEHREILQVKGPVEEGDYEIPFGRARIARPGSDATVVAVGRMNHLCLAAAETLAAEGASMEVIDPRTIAPFDAEAILASVAKTGRLLVVDEPAGPCGLAAEVAALAADRGFDDLDAPVKRLCGVPSPTPYSPVLEAAVLPSTATIEEAMRELLAE